MHVGNYAYKAEKNQDIHSTHHFKLQDLNSCSVIVLKVITRQFNQSNYIGLL